MERMLSLVFGDGRLFRWTLEFSQSGTLQVNLDRWSRKRPWARLGFCKCVCCPLTDGPHATCPVADVILEYAMDLADFDGDEPVSVTIHQEDGQDVSYPVMPLKEVVSELVRLAVYQSGCPIGRRLKPAMVGLPLFPTREQVLEALVQFFAALGGEVEERACIGLDDRHDVFESLARRLEDAGAGDIYVNAVVVQDALAAFCAMTAPELIRRKAATLV